MRSSVAETISMDILRLDIPSLEEPDLATRCHDRSPNEEGRLYGSKNQASTLRPTSHDQSTNYWQWSRHTQREPMRVCVRNKEVRHDRVAIVVGYTG